MRKIILFFIAVVALNATTPTYENVTRLYIATFERTPDVPGLKYWVNESGLNLEGIAMSFFYNAETKAKYYPDNKINLADFVDEIYLNLFDHYPDSVGKKYWVDNLREGMIHYSYFILAVINGAQGSDADILRDKTTNALFEIEELLAATMCRPRNSDTYWIGDSNSGTRCEYFSSGELFKQSEYTAGVRNGHPNPLKTKSQELGNRVI